MRANRDTVIKWRRSVNGLMRILYRGMRLRHLAKGFGELPYSFEILNSIYKDDRRFMRLFKEWVKSGYKKEKSVGFDRINFKRGYELSNIQVLSWEENRYKQRMEIKMLNGKPVIAKKAGVIIYRFKSQCEASRRTGIAQGAIGQCCRKEISAHSAGGLEWEFAVPDGDHKLSIPRIPRPERRLS